MKITIITPTHNSAKALKYNLDSVALQSYVDIEHIIVDNCSTDGTLELLNNYPHISRIISEKNFGVYDAINTGIACSTGDIIGILFPNSFLESAYSINAIISAFNLTKTDAVYGDLLYTNGDLSKIFKVCMSGEYKHSRFYTGWVMPLSALYIKKDIYELYGTYNTTFKYAADYEMMLWLFFKHKISVSYVSDFIVCSIKGKSDDVGLYKRLLIVAEERKAWNSLRIKYEWYTHYVKYLRKLWQYIYPLFAIKWLSFHPSVHFSISYQNRKIHVF